MYSANDLKQSRFLKKLIEKSDSALQYMVDNASNMNEEAVDVARFILKERSRAADYTTYSLLDLLEAKESINASLYPVQAQLLDQELAKRQYDDDINQKKLEHIATYKEVDETSSIRPRLDVTFKYKPALKNTDSYSEISLSEFVRLLNEPESYQVLLIEDSSIQLLIHYQEFRSEHGFKFGYRERYRDKEYTSKLHGISKRFALDFSTDFIERGKTVFDELDWNEVKETTFLDGIIAYSYIGFIVASLTFFLYSKVEEHLLKTDNVETILSMIPYKYESLFVISLVSLTVSAIKDRRQIRNLNKLTAQEVINTIGNILMIPVFIVILYFYLFLR